jgi:hypothetical protein
MVMPYSDPKTEDRFYVGQVVVCVDTDTVKGTDLIPYVMYRVREVSAGGSGVKIHGVKRTDNDLFFYGKRYFQAVPGLEVECDTGSTRKDDSKVNLSTAIFLVNKDVRAVRVSYDPNGDPNGSYVFKTLDQMIAVGDLVIIPTSTRHGFTVASVAAVDVDINLDDAVQYKWIAGRFDKAGYDDVLEKEAKVVDVVRRAEFRRKREQLGEAILANSRDELRTLELTSKPDRK